MKRAYQGRVERLAGNKLLEADAKAFLAIKPAYLGDIFHVNHSISSGRMLTEIHLRAHEWTEADYNRQPADFRAYFDKRKDFADRGRGYTFRHPVSVDHLIPSALGGLDHPRNYALMPARLNSSYGNGGVVEKLAMVGRHVRVKVCRFAREAFDATREQRERWLSDLAPVRDGMERLA